MQLIVAFVVLVEGDASTGHAAMAALDAVQMSLNLFGMVCVEPGSGAEGVSEPAAGSRDVHAAPHI